MLGSVTEVCTDLQALIGVYERINVFCGYSNLVQMHDPVSDVITVHEERNEIILVRILVMRLGKDAGVNFPDLGKVSFRTF